MNHSKFIFLIYWLIENFLDSWRKDNIYIWREVISDFSPKATKPRGQKIRSTSTFYRKFGGVTCPPRHLWQRRRSSQRRHVVWDWGDDKTGDKDQSSDPEKCWKQSQKPDETLSKRIACDETRQTLRSKAYEVTPPETLLHTKQQKRQLWAMDVYWPR